MVRDCEALSCEPQGDVSSMRPSPTTSFQAQVARLDLGILSMSAGASQEVRQVPSDVPPDSCPVTPLDPMDICPRAEFSRAEHGDTDEPIHTLLCPLLI